MPKQSTTESHKPRSRAVILRSIRRKLARRDKLIAAVAEQERDIGRMVHECREAGSPYISATDLSFVSGVHRTTLWALETGVQWTDVTPGHVAKFAAALESLSGLKGWALTV